MKDLGYLGTSEVKTEVAIRTDSSKLVNLAPEHLRGQLRIQKIIKVMYKSNQKALLRDLKDRFRGRRTPAEERDATSRAMSVTVAVLGMILSKKF